MDTITDNDTDRMKKVRYPITRQKLAEIMLWSEKVLKRRLDEIGIPERIALSPQSVEKFKDAYL